MDVTLERSKTGAEVAEVLASDDRLRRRLVAYARARFGIGEEAFEDLFQETFVELMKSSQLIEHADGFVFRLFHVRCCTLIGQSVRRRELAAVVPAWTEREEASPDVRVLLRQGFSQVSASCRRLLRAYYLEGRSLKETALELAVSSKGVWKLINRCVRRLKACLDR